MARSRIVKDAKVRRREILAAAYALFVRDGYDATTVSAILEAVGLSKGAFYHHFESKEEVMQALARQFAEQARATLEPLLERPGLSPVEKLNLLFSAGTQFKKEHASIGRAMADIYARDENLRLRQRIVAESIAVIGPLYVRILDEGKRDGSFDLEHPAETARLVMHLGTLLHDVYAEAIKQAATGTPGALADMVALVRRHVDAYVSALERILGLAARTLSLGDRFDDETIALFLTQEKS